MRFIKKLIYIYGLSKENDMVKRNTWKSIKRFVNWQFFSRLTNWSFVVPFVNETRLVIKKSMYGASGGVYLGLIEFNDMAFLIHYLRNTDLFLDIGANVGTYSVLASGVAGAETIGIEPIPATYQHYLDNVYINRLSDKITALNLGLGSEKGKLQFRTDLGCSNCVAHSDYENNITVDISTLNDVTEGKSASFLKIDVEGFEYHVLSGGKKVLHDPTLNIIIIELKGHAQQYGTSDDEIHDFLNSNGFSPFKYKPYSRELIGLDKYDGKHNTIYIRNEKLAQERIKNAPKFEVLGEKI